MTAGIQEYIFRKVSIKSLVLLTWQLKNGSSPNDNLISHMPIILSVRCCYYNYRPAVMEARKITSGNDTQGVK